MTRLWNWCEDRAAGGWLLAIAVTVVFTLAAVAWITSLSAATMRACGM